MKPNPGGQLDPEEILGRDQLIEDLWEILSGRNIYMNDLRRIGKTMIMNKMEHSPPQRWLVLKRDFGGVRTCAEFATQVFRDTHQLLSRKKRTLRRMDQWLGSIGEIPGIIKLKDGTPAPWKEVLSRTVADLHDEHKAGEEQVVFFWDEIPYMLDNIRIDEGAVRAMEVLDTLRSLSQDYPSVRFLLTGSVGIHHVLSQLRKEGYNNSPLNTFERVAPGPLDHAEAKVLAEKLIKGAQLNPENLAEAAESVASLTGDVPYYIHLLISRIPKGEPVDPGILETCLLRELNHIDNDWDLAHYRTRLSKYYPDKNDESVSLALLDSLAAAAETLSTSQLINEAKSIVAETDDEQIRSVLKRLAQDHYLTRDEDGNFSFRLEIVRRWWVIDRGL